jgi:hypothetical protein
VTVDVRLRPEADQDLADAAGWYEEHRPDLGQEFLDESGVLWNPTTGSTPGTPQSNSAPPIEPFAHQSNDHRTRKHARRAV